MGILALRALLPSEPKAKGNPHLWKVWAATLVGRGAGLKMAFLRPGEAENAPMRSGELR